MSDPTSASTVARTRGEVANEIGRSVSSIWERREGARPLTVETEYVGDVVRCVLQEDEAVDGDQGDGLTASGYGREVQASVARLTRRSVSAFIAKHDSKTGQTRNTFILEPIQIHY